MDQSRLDDLRRIFAPVLAVLKQHGAEITALQGLAVARPGYALEGDTSTPALVLAFHPPRPQIDLTELTTRFGVRVDSVDASPPEQIRGQTTPTFVSPLRCLLEPMEVPSFAPRRGTYQPPAGENAPRLDPVDADMEVTVCASPDAGWPTLRDFLQEGVRERLTVAMYDFTARHVEETLRAQMRDSKATLRLVLDARPASNLGGPTGVNGHDRVEADVVERFRALLGERFEVARASVGAHGAVPKAYHIKVASADGERVWLSTGNWQSSNLAPFDYAKPGDAPPLPLSRYNRDYHVVVRHPPLATCFAGFIEYDATLGGDFAELETDDGPMLLVPVAEAPEDFAAIKRYEPLKVQGRIKVSPLLTPDNFPTFVNSLLQGARRRVWIQNQYLTPNEDGDNFPEFDRLLELLGRLAGQELDVRLCLRACQPQHRDLILAAGVKASQIRLQRNCHAKLLVVDDDWVVVGSQNLSNDGFVANRDASLAFEHKEITDYFATIFEADWERASPVSRGDSFAARLATGESVPMGWTRVPWRKLYDSDPPRPTVAVSVPTHPTITAAGAEEDLPFFGVDAATGHRRRERTKDVARAIRNNQGMPGADLQRVGAVASTPSFGLPLAVNPESLSDMGWAVVWAPSVSNETKGALRPLLELRYRQVNDDTLFREFDYLDDETARGFLQRNSVDFGGVRPEAVPFYLLLVGDPAEMPFTFQTVLDVEYRVGRLHLPTPTAYARYAESVIGVENGGARPRDRVLHAFGPAHPGDSATTLSCDQLVRAAAGWLATYGAITASNRLRVQTDAGASATKARLQMLLRGKESRPELLFTAGHGLVFPPNSKQQSAEQGALVTADWDGFSSIRPADRMAGADVPSDADVLGLVAFLFACFGAGTPRMDSFPTAQGRLLADKPLVSALPQALLSHDRGAAIGVFGHIDRTLTWSIQPPGARVATDPFARAALAVLAGYRLGSALEDLNQRGASLAATLASTLAPSAPPLSDAELVRTWVQQRDAVAFVLLGDPAARLPR